MNSILSLEVLHLIMLCHFTLHVLLIFYGFPFYFGRLSVRVNTCLCVYKCFFIYNVSLTFFTLFCTIFICFYFILLHFCCSVRCLFSNKRETKGMDLSWWVESERNSGRGAIIRIYCIFNFKKYKNVDSRHL